MDTIRTMNDFDRYFPSEWVCFWFFVSLRWPSGFVCRKCGHTACKKVGGRWTLRCLNCNDQVSVKVGTVMQHSKLPLKKWLHAAFLIATNDGIPATRLKNYIDVCYETAYTLGQRIRHAMAERELLAAITKPSTIAVAQMENVTQLSRAMGWVAVALEVDHDTNIGGNAPAAAFAKRDEDDVGAGSDADMRSISGCGRVRMQVIRKTAAEADECVDLSVFIGEGAHDGRRMPSRTAVTEDIPAGPIQVRLSAVKSWLAQVFRRMVGRHLKRYLWEYAYRYNRRRERCGSIFAALVGDIARSTPLPYQAFLAGRP